MDEANAELGLHGYTRTPGPYRVYQQILEAALYAADNDHSFVQPAACPHSFD